MARPRKTVDRGRLVELAAKGFTIKGVAARLGISWDTLHRHYADAFAEGEALLADDIRAKQVEAALDRNG